MIGLVHTIWELPSQNYTHNQLDQTWVGIAANEQRDFRHTPQRSANLCGHTRTDESLISVITGLLQFY